MLTETQRKMASIQEIASLSPIENSDFLEVAMMKNLGWKVVVKKGEFKPGDKVIYFEIDSAIDVKDLPDCLTFLKDKGRFLKVSSLGRSNFLFHRLGLISV